MPFFSIIIPTYNRRNFILETIRTVFDQTFKDFEVIVVDDGSTDDTCGILEHILSDEKVSYFYQENAERAAARNLGIHKAIGEYVLFLDSDDLLLPDHLETLYFHIQKEGHPNFIAAKYVFNQEGSIIPSDLARASQGYIDYRFFLQGNPMACNFCLKRSNPHLVLFEPDRRYAIMEDWMFLLVNLAEDKMYLVDKITVHLREHEARSMRAEAPLLTEKRLLATDWIVHRMVLNEKERRQLLSGSFYFCAIHYYLDNNRKKALRYWWKSMQVGGVQLKHLFMAAKIMLGYSFVVKFGKRK